jgi:alkylation response protein AidB-like acyl-CoA dehydrogenase
MTPATAHETPTEMLVLTTDAALTAAQRDVVDALQSCLGDDVTAWRSVLCLPAIRDMLGSTDDGDLAQFGPLAVSLGRSTATLPLIDAFVAVRALRRTHAPEARDAATRIRAGTMFAGLTRAHLEGGRLVAPFPFGAAILKAHDTLILLESTASDSLPLANLGGLPLYSLPVDPTRSVVVAQGVSAARIYQTAIDEWRVLTACALLGVMDGALQCATQYAIERRQFDAPIGSFQAVAHQLATAAVHTEGLRTLLDETLAEWGGSGQQQQALLAFLHAARVAPQVAEISVHVHGGQGVTDIAPAAQFLRRAKAFAVAGGTRGSLYGELRATMFSPGSENISTEAESGTLSAQAIRDRARSFFTAMAAEQPDADGSVLLPALAKAGLLGMTWTGDELAFDLSPAEHLAVAEEAMDFGFELTALTTTMNVAKTLAIVGTPEQKRTILPGVADGTAIICLGYSEQQAGSDIAAVQTRAQRDAHGWRINGAKLYTSRAHIASYVFLLTRTDETVSKWKGLTTFLLPINMPGITIERLPMLAGNFTTATYYDDVLVPDTMRIGAPNSGAEVMSVALDFEHGGGSVPGRTLSGPGRRVLSAALTVATQHHDNNGARLVDDPMFGAAMVDHLTANRISAALERRSIRRAGANGTTGPLASILKLQSREAYQRACADILDLLGERSVLTREAPGALADGLFEECYRGAQAATIYGGTSEIQRTIIAERWLSLPRGNRNGRHQL